MLCEVITLVAGPVRVVEDVEDVVADLHRHEVPGGGLVVPDPLLVLLELPLDLVGGGVDGRVHVLRLRGPAEQEAPSYNFV